MKANFLKYGIIAILSVMLIPFNSYSRCTIRIGHPTGTYKDVSENPSGTELTCSGTGSAACDWSDGTPGIIRINGNPISEIQAGYMVQQYINNNIPQGTVYGDENIGFFSWYVDANEGIMYIFEDGQSS